MKQKNKNRQNMKIKKIYMFAIGQHTYSKT